jgi:hypothetical protein
MIDPISIQRLFPGTFNFFQRTAEDLRLAVPDPETVLPNPQRIFLDSEEATPLMGFAVLMSDDSIALRESLEAYLQAEIEQQVAVAKRTVSDPKRLDAAWERYKLQLERNTENAVRSSFGRQLPSIFWLYHSIAVSRLFKEMPRRIRRLDLEIGRSQGNLLRYRVYNRFLDRVLAVTYDVAHRVAEEAEEQEQALFPTLLSRMRDNVLILTEDHVSFDLSELDGYFRGFLHFDGKEFRGRLNRLESWLTEQLRVDRELRSTAEHLLRAGHNSTARDLFTRPGYVRMLSERRGYDQDALLDPQQVKTWESLLIKLKEFEILLSLRRMVLPVRERMGAMTCQAPHIPGSGMATRTVTLSTSTRPLDFTTTWVIDPLVRRCGLIYDITDFSAIVSYLGRSGSEDQDTSYRSIFRFQRWVNQMARSRRLQLEKYLGDGALYSGRHPSRLLHLAIELQRYYSRALLEGFPFDRGMRIALNYGEYRLLPVEEGTSGTPRRYEFFGHGIVELSRLVTGKAMREIDEIKNLLIGLGYPAAEVESFFAPALRQNVDLVDKIEESRHFYCYINPNGTLINEGIVATQQFIQQLEREGSVTHIASARDGNRSYLVLTLGEAANQLLVGLRKLGLASLKGLAKVPVYEIIDGELWRDQPLPSVARGRLLVSLDREFADTQRAPTSFTS